MKEYPLIPTSESTVEDPLASQNAILARSLYAQLGELNLKRKQLKQQIAALDEIELQLESQIVALSKKL